MNPYQQAFVDRCKARGFDPAKVVEFSKQAAAASMQKQAAADRRAQAVKQALAAMTPYQQGFAIRCAQRGVPAQKVAEFCIKKAAVPIKDVPAAARIGTAARAGAAVGGALRSTVGGLPFMVATPAASAVAGAVRAVTEARRARKALASLDGKPAPDHHFEVSPEMIDKMEGQRKGLQSKFEVPPDTVLVADPTGNMRPLVKVNLDGETRLVPAALPQPPSEEQKGKSSSK